MANVKISELPVVTSVASSDVLPVVASTTTSKLTMTNLANSMPQVSSSISASFALTSSFFGGTVSTASFALTSSFYGGNVTSASYALTSSFAVSASWAPGGAGGPISVSGSTIYSNDPVTSGFTTDHGIFLGDNAGYTANNAIYSTFIGYQAGYDAKEANSSNFIGISAGWNADSASRSNFIGQSAGSMATNALYSNFIGYTPGANAFSASYSNLIGYRVGLRISTPNGIGSNNTIIGTNITLEDDRKNSINLGGIIFATGSYSNTGGNPFSGSMTEAKVGINKSLPAYTLDVSGSVGIATVLHLTEVNPLPAGNIGDLAVSASHLWFYNGAWAQLD
jgi:hypothetical protein